MARYGIWKPLEADKHPPTMARYDLFLIHTMVGSLNGTDSYFRFGNGYGYDGTESHWGLGHDGQVYQWTDTAYRADCNGDSNHRALSVECADVGTGFPSWNLKDGSQVPGFTSAQIDALVKLIDWACDTHDIPRVEVADSAPGRRGIGWHRKGVNSSPLFRTGYRQAGGELWSTSVGKVCPGDRRIAQIRADILPRLQGKSAPPAKPESPAAPPPPEEDLLSSIKNAIVFARQTGSNAVYECNLLAGTRWHITSTRDLNDRAYVLDQAGIPYSGLTKKDGGGRRCDYEVDNISAFGAEITK